MYMALLFTGPTPIFCRHSGPSAADTANWEQWWQPNAQFLSADDVELDQDDLEQDDQPSQVATDKAAAYKSSKGEKSEDVDDILDSVRSQLALQSKVKSKKSLLSAHANDKK